jgi:trk system potassium uptake protein TrkH
MNIHFIKYSLGKLLHLLSFFLAAPTIMALVQSDHSSIASVLADPQVAGFLTAIGLSVLTGFVLIRLPVRRGGEGRTIREGFAIVTFGWLLLTLFGGIPLFVYLMHSCTGPFDAACLWRNFTDASFEAMSGFTTTGASILPDVECLPASLHFWRSMTHWLGGMGIVTLGLAIFPAFGFAAYQLFRGEVTGPTADRLAPTMAKTAKLLWGIYASFTAIQALLLLCGGMSLLDAVCYSFGSMSTGGFATRNASVAAYHSAYIEWVIIVFMFLGGMNFIIHYNVIFLRKWDFLRTNHEFRSYFAVIVVAILVITVILRIEGLASKSEIARSYRVNPLTHEALDQKISDETGRIAGFGATIRHATFQVVSIITTTGYVSADFDTWPNAAKVFLVMLMFFGGCAGSTSGGMKIVRIMVIIKASLRELLSMIQPRQIIAVRIADRTIEEKQVRSIVGYFATFMMVTAGFILIMSIIIGDFTTAATSVAATICNVGPGLSGVGAMETYAWIPSGGKWVLFFSMLLGRLEIYTVLIAFAPASWRK